jgi:N-acetylneuraminic acid mutarotase
MNVLLNSGHHMLTNLANKVKLTVSHNPRALTLAIIMILSIGAYTADILINEAKYRLSTQSVKLIGGVNDALADKISLDKNTDTYRFNAENISPEMTGEKDPAAVAAMLSSQKQQTGGGSKDSENLYSLDLPIDPAKGTTIYDSNSKTSFKLIPEFAMNAGRSGQGRIVYPLEKGGQAVYSVKGNGVKEDIVLTKPRGDELSFTYRLELPKTLDARLDDRGNLGVYSVDPAVSSAIAGALQSGASSTDTERLKDVQQNGDKTHLAYVIPAPTIIQSGERPQGHSAKAVYKLDGDKLTVSTSGLEKLVYPISIDPSVVVTSTSDFSVGNNEENISFDTDAISRFAPTGGTVGSWTSTANFTTARYDYASTTYNGYVYMTGGRDASAVLSDVQYAPLNADGTVGSWTATTGLLGGLQRHAMVAYNGYLYTLGGVTSLGTGSSDQVNYAPINANGTVGAWAVTANFTSGVTDLTSVAYNGYLYIIGGSFFNGSTTSVNTVRYAPLNADGTVGSWTTTTGFTIARHSHTSIVHNGYLYVIGGRNNGSSTPLGTVQYAPINSDGSIGTWTATTTLATARDEHATIFYSGYLYVIGGRSGTSTPLSDVQYASINADGSLGAWQSTTAFSVSRYSHTAAAYKGKLYVMGGYDGTTLYNTVQYTSVSGVPSPTVGMASWATTTALGAGSGSAAAKVTTRANHGSAVYNGYMYLVAGTGVSTTIANVHYAPLNANGTVGAWATTTSIPAARAGLATVAANGYLYAIGGQDTAAAFMTTSYYAPINANGTIGTWATTTALTSGRSNQGMVNYNGYMYVTGGIVTGGAPSTLVEYAVINANGTLGAWTSTTALSAARGAHAAAVYNGFIYAIGGVVGTVTVATTSYAPVNGNGTIGTWSATTDLPLARSYINARIYQDYVFIVGGYQGGGTESNTTYYAKMNIDGTLGAWSTGTSFTTARDSHGVEIYNGYIYLTGGWNGTTIYGDVQYAQLSYTLPPSDRGPVKAWAASTAFTNGRNGHTSVAYNGYLYVIGGFTASGGNSTDIQYAPINSDGTIGTWTATTGFATARNGHTSVVYNGYLYVMGGYTGSVFRDDIQYAPINSDGTIGTWATTTNLPSARDGHAAAAYNGYLYVFGGNASGSLQRDVQYAPINANGTIGAWTATTSFANVRNGHTAFIYNGHAYVVGGINGGTYYADVQYALVNANGTIGPWAATTSLGTARTAHATVAYGGHVYVIGGDSSVSSLTDVQYAPINANGTIGAWTATTSFTTARSDHAVVAYNGRLYMTGGYSPSRLTNVDISGMEVTPFVARYTRVVDFGQNSSLNGATIAGIVPSNQVITSIKVAGSDGVFGAWQSPKGLAGAPLTNMRYVMFKVALDDSYGLVPFAATSGRSSVTDVTLDYTLSPVLTPGNRLHHNKYFDGSGVLQPLQTQ